MSQPWSSSYFSYILSLRLTGVLILWMGIMKIEEMGGVVKVFARLVGSFFNKLFLSQGKDHPIMMKIAVNMLYLDNATTPICLKALTEMQETNPS